MIVDALLIFTVFQICRMPDLFAINVKPSYSFEYNINSVTILETIFLNDSRTYILFQHVFNLLQLVTFSRRL